MVRVMIESVYCSYKCTLVQFGVGGLTEMKIWCIEGMHTLKAV